MPEDKTAVIANKARQKLAHEALAADAARAGSGLASTYDLYARMADKEIRELLAVPDPPCVLPGREVVPDSSEVDRVGARDTLQAPNAVNIGASGRRVALADDAGVFATAVDAAESIEAKNSLEKMLAHQLALCHEMVFKMAARGWESRDSVEQARAVNAISRMMTTFQTGLETLARIRSGGKQVVTVQHVAVNEGGQAVIAGKLEARGRGRGRRQE